MTAEQLRRVAATILSRDDDFSAFDAMETPEELHCLVDNWDWRDEKTAELLTHVIRSPLCDNSLAYRLFWESEPQILLAYATVEEAAEQDSEYVAAQLGWLTELMAWWEAWAFTPALYSLTPGKLDRGRVKHYVPLRLEDPLPADRPYPTWPRITPT
jgi:hypothetical protein